MFSRLQSPRKAPSTFKVTIYDVTSPANRLKTTSRNACSQDDAKNNPEAVGHGLLELVRVSRKYAVTKKAGVSKPKAALKRLEDACAAYGKALKRTGNYASCSSELETACNSLKEAQKFYFKKHADDTEEHIKITALQAFARVLGHCQQNTHYGMTSEKPPQIDLRANPVNHSTPPATPRTNSPQITPPPSNTGSPDLPPYARVPQKDVVQPRPPYAVFNTSTPELELPPVLTPQPNTAGDSADRAQPTNHDILSIQNYVNTAMANMGQNDFQYVLAIKQAHLQLQKLAIDDIQTNPALWIAQTTVDTHKPLIEGSPNLKKIWDMAFEG